MRSLLALSTVLLLPASLASAQSILPTLGTHTIVPRMVVCADIPVRSMPSPAPQVLGGHNTDGHRTLGPGDIVVIGGGPYTVGQRFIARRMRGGAMSMVQRADRIGALETSGWLTVTATDENSTLARVDAACSNVEAGDFVESATDLSLPDTATGDGPPDYTDRGSVLFGVDHREAFGDGDVFSIDRGAAAGVTTGSRLAIFRDRRNGLPLVYVGDAVVVDLADQTAKAVLVVARDAVQAGDIALRRKTQ